MTNQEIIDYYASLLILQYLQKENAFATVQALVTPVIMNQLPIAVQNAFSVSTAVGVQLDVIGKYVGASRNGYTFTGPVTLDDSDFRVLIQLRILTNNAGSSLSVIQELLHNYFNDQIFVFDTKNMRLSYYLNSSVGSQELAEMIIVQRLLPKPMAVQLGSVIYAPVINTFYGFRTYDYVGVNNSPMNTYDNYELDRPWLSYDNALFVS